MFRFLVEVLRLDGHPKNNANDDSSVVGATSIDDDDERNDNANQDDSSDAYDDSTGVVKQHKLVFIRLYLKNP